VEYTILTYHRVLPRAEVERISSGMERRYVTPAEEFAAQMACLKERGLRVLSFEELRGHLRNGASGPQKAVLLTFDDGREDHLRVVLPILKAHGLRATFFVVTGLMGRPGYLTWEQAAELRAAGMEIGSHTHTHPRLDTLEAAEAERELTLSQAAIEERLGGRALALALPHGLGGGWLNALPLPYEFVCTSHLGVNTEATPRHSLRRLPLRHGDPLARFVAFAEIERPYIRRCQVNQALLDLSKSVLGRRVFNRVRQAILG
jgi:peptidoglycan/xylan/chitin deacetylase (PgdA/CDA1 family)